MEDKEKAIVLSEIKNWQDNRFLSPHVFLPAENPAGKDSFLTDRMEMVHTAY